MDTILGKRDSGSRIQNPCFFHSANLSIRKNPDRPAKEHQLAFFLGLKCIRFWQKEANTWLKKSRYILSLLFCNLRNYGFF